MRPSLAAGGLRKCVTFFYLGGVDGAAILDENHGGNESTHLVFVGIDELRIGVDERETAHLIDVGNCVVL